MSLGKSTHKIVGVKFSTLLVPNPSDFLLGVDHPSSRS